MARLLLFFALTYCFNKVVGMGSEVDMSFDIPPMTPYGFQFLTSYYVDLFYVFLPFLALLYARITKFIFTFNRKEGPLLLKNQGGMPDKREIPILTDVEPKKK